MPQISVIIPVYNVEKYLPRCLDSVINQTFRNIEIICINDLSTDGSLDILNTYASKDSRIKVINLEKNSGVSNARNLGIDAASGDYIAFLDSDDFWETNFIQCIKEKLAEGDVDIVLFGHNKIEVDCLNKDELVNEIKNALENNDYLPYFNDFVNVVWDKVYKTKFLRDNKIKFPLNIHPSEDVLFALNCFSLNPKITFIPKSFYNYDLSREDSAMKKYDKLVINQINAANIMFESDFYKNSDDEYKKRCIIKIIDSLAYFCLVTVLKKCSMIIFMPQLRKFVLSLENNIPYHLIDECGGYQTLRNFCHLRHHPNQEAKQK